MPTDIQRGCGSTRASLDLWGVRPWYLTDPDLLLAQLRVLIKKYELGERKVFVDKYEPFQGQPAGYEMLVTLEDSFILVETWPQGKPDSPSPEPYMMLIVQLCNHSKDRSADAPRVADEIQGIVELPDTQFTRDVTKHGP
jgi:hypothetical protein